MILVVLALALRALRLDFQPLWWDEGYSVWFATHSLGQMAGLTAQDIHPPLYYALLHAWIGLLGPGVLALRLCSVAAGVLAVPGIYLAGRRLLGPAAAWLAALLLAINPLHVYYSQEVRMYGLVALLSVAVLTTAWDALRRDLPSWRSLLPYTCLAVAALYTQYYAAFLPAGLTLVALWRWRGCRVALLRWLAAQAASALLYLPWLLYATPRLVPYISQKVVHDADRPLGLAAYLARHLSVFVAGHLEGPLAPFWPLALLFVAVGLLERAWAHAANRQRRSAPAARPAGVTAPGPQAMLLVVLLSALGLGFLVGLRYPFFPERGERLLLLALPAFVLLAAAALDRLLARSHTLAVAVLGTYVLVAGASLWAFYNVPRYAGDDYRPLIGQTIEQGLPEDTVFCVYPWQAGYRRAYGAASGPRAVLTPALEWGSAVQDALDAALARGRVWFPAHLALGAGLEHQIEDYLATGGRRFANQWYGPGTRLSAWAGERSMPGQEVAIPAVRFAGQGDLLIRDGSTAGAAIPAANALAPLTLNWQGQGSRPELAVSIRLVDDLGQIWAQHDYEIPPAAGPAAWQLQDRIALLIPAGTPPGRYRLQLQAQRKGAAQLLEVSADGSGPRASDAWLAALTVAAADRALGPERLPIATRSVTALGDGLDFLGFSAAPSPAVPGELRKVSLFWRANAAPRADYIAFLQVLDARGQAIPVWEAPVGAAYPATRWAPGALMRTQAAFRVPAGLPDGRYQVIAGLMRATDRARLSGPGGSDHLRLDALTVRGRRRVFAAPRPAHPLDARFGDSARLVGYDLAEPAALQPGQALALTLYWQAGQATDRPYTVFVHLVDASGASRGSGDGEPGQAQAPTTGWTQGEYLTDAHQVWIQPDAPPGAYRLAVGLYDPASGRRLAGPGGSDQVLLDRPVVVGP